MTVTKKRYKAMLAYALPLLKQEMDHLKIQHALVNHFDFLTNNEECEKLTRDVIRACEVQIELGMW